MPVTLGLHGFQCMIWHRLSFWYSGGLGEIENIPTADQKWDDRFEVHKAKYGKTYTDAKEHAQRKSHFRNNYR